MPVPAVLSTAPQLDVRNSTLAGGGRGDLQPSGLLPSKSWQRRPQGYFQRTGSCRYRAGAACCKVYGGCLCRLQCWALYQ